MIDISLLLELNTFKEFTFHPDEHYYMYKGEQCISTTQLIKRFKEPFNEERRIAARSYHSGKCKNLVKAEFKFHSDTAQFKGNTLHSFAEHYISNKVTSIDYEKRLALFGDEDPVTEILEALFDQFKRFCKDREDVLIPVRSEYVIGDPEFLIGGMIDQLYYDTRDKKFHIYDWKTNKNMNHQSNQRFFSPLNSMPASDVNTYSLQLSLYRLILERNTSLEFGESMIVWFNKDNETYIEVPCYDYRKEVMQLMQYYHANNSID